MRLRSLFALIFICVCAGLNAQELLKIKGKVLSSENKPVEYTTVSLESSEDGVVAEAATDAKGEFTVEAKAGQYVIVIEPLGYDVIEKQVNLESALVSFKPYLIFAFKILVVSDILNASFGIAYKMLSSNSSS